MGLLLETGRAFYVVWAGLVHSSVGASRGMGSHALGSSQKRHCDSHLEVS